MYVIKRKDRLFTHVGIYVNDDYVIHFSSLTNNFLGRDKCVRISTLNSFALSRKTKIVGEPLPCTMEELESRVLFFQNNYGDYHFITNNCYTFLLWSGMGISHATIKNIFSFCYKNRLFLLAQVFF